MDPRRVGTLLLLVVSANVVHVFGKGIPSYAGPYILSADKVTSCKTDVEFKIDLRLSHFNPAKPYDLQVLNGNITTQKDFSDSVWVYGSVAKQSNNQWKENFFHFAFGRTACSALRKHMPNMFRVFAKYSGSSMDPKAPCVLQRGAYTIKNETMNWELPHFPTLPYGRYRSTALARGGSSDNSPVYFCTTNEVNIIPRP